jgi:hypothetical protein
MVMNGGRIEAGLFCEDNFLGSLPTSESHLSLSS